MTAEIHPDIVKAINRLRAEAREKNRIADELHRTYTGQDPAQGVLMDDENLGGRREAPPAATVEAIVGILRGKSARISSLAKFFGVTEARIKELISSSGGKLSIPDWRGWVKVGKHK